MQKHRNFSLDFVRGISILLIIYFHYNCAISRIVSNSLIHAKYYLFTGTIGVSLFFILSGASLSLSTKENYSTLSFFKKRFMGIFPIFWVTYIIAVLARSFFLGTTFFAGKNPFSFLLTIFGIDGFFLYKISNYYIIGEWFLGCIIILYALFPVIRFVFIKNKYLTLLLFLIICITLEGTYNFDMPLKRFPLFRAFEFIFGMYWITISYNKSRLTNCMLLLSSILGILSVNLFGFDSNIFVSNAVLGIFSFIFLMSLVNLFEKRIPKQIFVSLSKYSYAAFLLHHIEIVIIITILNDYQIFENYNFAILTITVIFIFISSLVTYNFTEYIVPFIRKNAERITQTDAKKRAA